MARLLLSAAHTIQSPGAVYGDLREADLTRKIVSKISTHLQNEKVEFEAVPLDLMLLKRIDWINASGYSADKGDFMIEVHVNDGNKRGIEGWYAGNNLPDNKSKGLAEFVLKELCEATGYQNQGAKSEFQHELGSLLILNQTKPISIAVELLYIDNPEDNVILKDEAKLDDLAKKFAEVIKKYIEAHKDDKPTVVAQPIATPTAPTFPNFGGNYGMSDPANDDLGGFGGGFPSFGGGMDPMAGGMNAGGTKSPMMADREERKTMITETYKKILGKEPKQSDLNYFLNMGITETQLIDKIFKSKDHSQLIEDAKEANELRTKSKTSEGELIELKAKLQDLQSINDSLNNLLKFKNSQIAQMQEELSKRNIIKKGEYYDYNDPAKYQNR